VSSDVRAVVRRFDAWLSHRYGVFEFSQIPDCLFRLQVDVARHCIPLPDCQVEPGEPVLLLHMWNERLLALDTLSPGLGRAKTMQRSFLRSLGEVAGFLDDHPGMAEVCAIGGVTVLLESDDHEGGARLVERLGFTVLPFHSPLGGFGEFWENFYSWVLIWAYNPSDLPYRGLRSLRRKEFWISAGEFRRRFGQGE
jgi:hypothetical protein